MSGLNISCGDFHAGDKAGTAFERVLSELPDVASELQQHILSGFDHAEHILIEPANAAQLIPSLRRYRKQLITEIGHDNPLQEMSREEKTGVCSIKLKWGEGRGSRLYCAINLLAACEKSAIAQQPVLVCLA
jgi:hypothetical protein